uniref:Defensin beta 13 n=1 Tax=Peromyscus maniculatus bairdii TaxID=230844 RepID=A0A8C8UMQ7_PERMB
MFVAGPILLVELYPARVEFAFYRMSLCTKLGGLCETDCLTFKEKTGSCRADLTPLCCRKGKKH